MSTKTHTTAENFAKWEEKARIMSNYSLVFSIQDCMEAAKAVRAHDALAEGVYMDEMHTYVAERVRRQRSQDVAHG